MRVEKKNLFSENTWCHSSVAKCSDEKQSPSNYFYAWLAKPTLFLKKNYSSKQSETNKHAVLLVIKKQNIESLFFFLLLGILTCVLRLDVRSFSDTASINSFFPLASWYLTHNATQGLMWKCRRKIDSFSLLGCLFYRFLMVSSIKNIKFLFGWFWADIWYKCRITAGRCSPLLLLFNLVF